MVYAISGTGVAIVVGVIIAVVIGAIGAFTGRTLDLVIVVLEKLNSYLLTIEIVIIVISVILAIANIISAVILHKKIVLTSILSIISYAIGCSQLVFSFHYSFLKLFAMNNGIFQLIMMMLWLIYVLANIAITFIAQGACFVDVGDDAPFCVLLCGGAGIIGWIVNIIFFVI